jgi:hypothetical protein
VFCRVCGRQIEADARFCRYCGKPQEDPAAISVAGAENPGSSVQPGAQGGPLAGLRGIFPRHHLQDEFMHVSTIVAVVLAVAGFVLGLFPTVGYLGQTALLFSIALLLFLIVRESTLSHVRRGHEGAAAGRRYHAQREDSAEAAAAESAPPGSHTQK